MALSAILLLSMSITVAANTESVYWLGKHSKFGETAYRWVQKIETPHAKNTLPQA